MVRAHKSSELHISYSFNGSYSGNCLILRSSGGSICYENTFPGGYYQYACGASIDAKTIATTYSGQNWASQLQIIYTQLTLATTEAASSTILSTTTIIQSSSTSASSSTQSASALLTNTSSASRTFASSSLAVGAQPVASTLAASVAAAGPGPQAQAGIIAGSVVGGVGVLFAILALGCGLMRRRQRKKAEERARSIPTREKSMSIK